MSKTDEETRWENAAAAYDNGKGLILREFDPDDKNEMSGVYDALCVTGIGAMPRLRGYVRRLREEGNAQTRYAYLVTGEIERSQTDAGTRYYELFRLAKGGYYPDGMGPDTAFSVKSHTNDDAKRLLSFSVCFTTQSAADSFLVHVDAFVNRTRGISVHIPFETKRVKKNQQRRLILESDYIPNRKDGEAPHDSPVWDVEVSSMDMSGGETIVSKSTTVYKYQRIEADSAFARNAPEGAHIFPKAECTGHYKWLEKASFNLLALSRDGHKNFHGTANGKGVLAATSSMVALEPTMMDEIQFDHKRCIRISNRLWCRTKSLARSWRPFLPNNVSFHEEGGHCYYEPVYLYCEANRTVVLNFEQQQNADGTLQEVCLTAIPGVKDHTTLASWNAGEQNVAVSEIMKCLLTWSFKDTRRIWREIP